MRTLVLVQPEEERLEREQTPVEGEHDHRVAEVTHRRERGGGGGDQGIGGLDIVGEEVVEGCARVSPGERFRSGEDLPMLSA